jgi:hypothetical protein
VGVQAAHHHRAAARQRRGHQGGGVMAEKYFAELERVWQQNRGSGLQKYFDIDFEFGLRRAKALRGPDLARELIRLASMTDDMRFKDALFALIEHGIVDRKFNFLPWEPRWWRQGRQKLELVMYAAIHDLQSRCGSSLRRASALLAAYTGWPATSFAAAIKDLELLYRKHPRWHCDLPEKMTSAEFVALVEKVYGTAAELEKSCRTSIPTTADN